MKKRIITLLAVLALLVTCAVFAVQAEGETTTEPTYIDLATFKCPCSDCNGQPYTGTWITYDDIIAGTSIIAPVDGAHYYIDQSLTPGQQISVGANVEAVYVIDNATIKIGGNTAVSGRATLVNGGKMHLIGNNGYYSVKSTGNSNGIMGQISGSGELHLYGDLNIYKDAGSTGVSTNSGLYRLYAGLLQIHDCDGMGLPTTKDPVLNAPALANTTSSLGGISNLENANCRFVMDAGTLNGTSQCYRGGVLSNAGGTITINGGTINGGIAGNRGGVIMNNSGTVNMTDGTINANADMTKSYRGVVLAGGTMNFSGGTIISANKGVGDGIAITGGTLTLSGDATVQNKAGTFENNIWRWNTADGGKGTIQVADSWTGSASINVEKHGLSNLGNAVVASYLFYGSLENGVFTKGTASTHGTATKLNLYLEDANFENPQMGGFQQYITTCRAGLYEDGELTDWYITPGAAISAYADSDATEKYVKLWADYTTTVNDEVVMDLNGRDITKTTLGEGTIYAFDSTVEAGEAGASITAAAQPITQIGGKTYVVTDGVVYPVDVKVTNVSLRPGTTEASMYYTAQVVANAAAGIDAWGVAITLDADETELANHLYTRETDAAKMDEFNGVLVKGIAKNGADDNAARAAQPIYAKAYIEVDGQVAMSAAVNKTLKQVVDAVVAMNQTGLTQVQVAAIEAMQATAWFASINA